MQVGSLVRYRNTNINNGLMGVVTKRNPIDGFRWVIHWANGQTFQEHQMHLEVICSK